MPHQISNRELTSFFINEVFRLDKRVYLFLVSNLKARKIYLPSFNETCNYINIGNEFVNRVEAEFEGHDIVQRRATYFFFRERFQKAYAEILGIPSFTNGKIKLTEKEIELKFKSYFNNNIASLPYTKLPIASAYAYTNLKYITKVIWIEFTKIKTEQDFANYLQNKTAFILGVSKNDISNHEKLYEALKNDFVLLVFNNSERAKNYKYYNQIKEQIKSENGNLNNYLQMIEINHAAR